MWCWLVIVVVVVCDDDDACSGVVVGVVVSTSALPPVCSLFACLFNSFVCGCVSLWLGLLSGNFAPCEPT